MRSFEQNIEKLWTVIENTLTKQWEALNKALLSFEQDKRRSFEQSNKKLSWKQLEAFNKAMRILEQGNEKLWIRQ